MPIKAPQWEHHPERLTEMVSSPIQHTPELFATRTDFHGMPVGLSGAQTFGHDPLGHHDEWQYLAEIDH